MLTEWKHLISLLPNRYQIAAKQLAFAWRIRTGSFVSNEPEFHWIEGVIRPGDSVIDIGASVGVYTLRFSDLVGELGRVYSFEPVPESFKLLVANASFCRYRNVTLINMAASDRSELTTMSIPRSANRLRNYYRAHLSSDEFTPGRDNRSVFCCPVDSFDFPASVRLVKIDTEGHEMAVLRGMQNLIERDRPLLIVEANSPNIYEWLAQYYYRHEHLPDSPNDVFVPEHRL